MNEEINALIQQIGSGLLESLEQAGIEEGQWERAWLVIGMTEGFVGAFARYLKPDETGEPDSFDPDFELVIDPVVELHKQMAAEHNSRWTGAIFHLTAPTKFNVDFHYPEEGEEDLDWYGRKMRE